MSTISHELMQELLRQLRQRIDKTEAANRDLRSENTSLRRITTVHQHDIGDLCEALHRMGERLDQIEKRLELRAFPQIAQSPYNPSN